MKCVSAFVLCILLHSVQASSSTDAASANNPIRKVVSLLQSMSTKVEAQVETEEKLHDKFMCNCKTAIPDLEKSIAANSAKAPAVQAELDEARSELAKLKEELLAHSDTAAAAKKALDEAAGVRESEKKAFDADASEKSSFIASIKKSLPALTGNAEQVGLLQTSTVLQTDLELQATLRRAASADSMLTEVDRDSITAFLSTGRAGADQSVPELVGILQNMQSDYEKDLAEITQVENEAASLYEELKESKSLQIKSVNNVVRKKTSRRGDLSLSAVTLKHDKKDADAMLEADTKMLQNLQADCTTEASTYEKRSASRSEELRAIAETIKILSNDDALDVFKSTLPGPAAAAFLQTTRTGTIQVRLKQARAAAAVFGSDSGLQSLWQPHKRSGIKFLQLALMAKKVDFTKVNRMVDDMIALLKREQKDDDTTIQTCKVQLHKTESKKKEIETSISEQKAEKEERIETLQVITDDLKDLQADVSSLDKLVADATKERQEQNSDFTGTMASNTAAKEILEFAKKRLAAFYAPEDSSKGAFAQKSPDMAMPKDEFFRVLDARAPSVPSIAKGVKGWSLHVSMLQQQNNHKVLGGVTEMLNKLIADVNAQMAEAKHDEDHSQKVYETMLTDASSKRATYVKSIQAKEAAKAENEISNTREGGELADTYKESKANKAFELQMHKECDWLMQNADIRKKGRKEEADNLVNAKAILHGSTSFAQVQAHSLRGGK